ncbi:MAG TPA: HD-GYP domain-containing protein [Symbiobacteriaceae bacterium]|nr:HD-GYP domain-containing protein [Symbiobacteriaceae bacterium]
MRRLPVALRGLIIIAVVALAVILTWTLYRLLPTGAWTAWAVTLVVGLAELVPIEVFPELRQDRTSFTLGSLGLAFLLAWPGPEWAVIGAALHGLIVTRRARAPWFKAVYNIGAVTVAMWAAGQLISLTARYTSVHMNLLLIGLSAGLYVAVNHASVLMAVSIQTRQPLIPLWRAQFTWVGVQQWLLTLAGISLGYAFVWAGWYAVLLVSPLVLIRTTFQRYVHSQSEHTRELEHFANQLITTLAAVVDARDAYTFGHSAQVARYAVAMGKELGYAADDLERLRVGALLHDIGKVGVPEAILFKPGKLEPWEYQVMKQHAAIGYQIVGKIDRLQYVADIIHQHHEWFDGNGYPRGLGGEEILRDARIVGVADALESLMSDRPYRKGRSLGEAMAELRRFVGTQFDPDVLGALERVIANEGPAYFVNSAVLVEASHSDLVAAANLKQAASAAQ